MFFKKRDDSDVDVLEKIKEKISEDNNENSLSGDDESFLNEVLSENDLEEVLSENDLEKNGNADDKKEDSVTLTDEEILDDINKTANEAVNNNMSEQDDFEDSINDDDLLDEVDKDNEEEDNEIDNNDSFELKNDDLDLSEIENNNDNSKEVILDDDVDTLLEKNKETTIEEKKEELVANDVENIVREDNRIATDNSMDNKISFINENNSIKSVERQQNVDFSISKKTKDNVRNHITELIEDVKNHVSEKKSNKVSLSNNDKTIAQLATEIIRPVIIKYLDVNLDKIVSDVIRSEIKKIITDINNEDR